MAHNYIKWLNLSAERTYNMEIEVEKLKPMVSYSEDISEAKKKIFDALYPNSDINTDELVEKTQEEIEHDIESAACDGFYIAAAKKRIFDTLYSGSDLAQGYKKYADAVRTFEKIVIMTEALSKMIDRIKHAQIAMVPQITTMYRAKKFNELTSVIEDGIRLIDTSLNGTVMLSGGANEMIKNILTQFNNIGMTYVGTSSCLIDDGCNINEDLSGFTNWMSDIETSIQ
jgi:hypothetical protein